MSNYLRVPTFFHQTFGVYHVYCNFILGYICRITLNFGTLKDGRLLINIFAVSNCFRDRNIFQNDVDSLSKIDDTFLTKSWTLHLIQIIQLCSNFASLWYRNLLWYYKENFRLPMTALILQRLQEISYWNINFYTDIWVHDLSCFHCCC